MSFAPPKAFLRFFELSAIHGLALVLSCHLIPLCLPCLLLGIRSLSVRFLKVNTSTRSSSNDLGTPPAMSSECCCILFITWLHASLHSSYTCPLSSRDDGAWAIDVDWPREVKLAWVGSLLSTLVALHVLLSFLFCLLPGFVCFLFIRFRILYDFPGSVQLAAWVTADSLLISIRTSLQIPPGIDLYFCIFL